MNGLSAAVVPLLFVSASAGCRLMLAGLTAESSAVRIVKPEAISHCTELGVVNGGSLGDRLTSAEEKLIGARNELRNEAAKQGGNYVTVDRSATLQNSVDLWGRACRCERPPSEEAPRTAGAGTSPQPPGPAPGAEQLLQSR